MMMMMMIIIVISHVEGGEATKRDADGVQHGDDVRSSV